MMSDKNVDELLQHGLVQVPDEFRNSVMQQVAEYERQNSVVGSIDLEPMTWWQWSAVITGSILGIGQVLRFIFAMWIVTAAG